MPFRCLSESDACNNNVGAQEGRSPSPQTATRLRSTLLEAMFRSMAIILILVALRRRSSYSAAIRRAAAIYLRSNR